MAGALLLLSINKKKNILCSGKDSLTSNIVYGTTDVNKEPLFLEVFPLSKQVSACFGAITLTVVKIVAILTIGHTFVLFLIQMKSRLTGCALITAAAQTWLAGGVTLFTPLLIPPVPTRTLGHTGPEKRVEVVLSKTLWRRETVCVCECKRERERERERERVQK